MGSKQQQSRVGCGGDDGGAEAPSCFLGPELPTESWAIRAQRLRGIVGSDQSGWINELDPLASGTGLQASIESRGAALGQGAAPWALSPEFWRTFGGCGERRQEEEGRAGGAVSTAVGWDGSGMGSTAAADDGGRRRRPMLRADGGFWHMGLDGSGQLLAREGQEDTRREEGPSGGRATADGGGRRR